MVDDGYGIPKDLSDCVGTFDRFAIPMLMKELPRMLREAERVDRDKLRDLVVEQCRLLNMPQCYAAGCEELSTIRCACGDYLCDHHDSHYLSETPHSREPYGD